MSKGFATLLGCAVLVWSAANAPGWSLGVRSHADATPLPTAKSNLAAANADHGKLYVDQWLTEHSGDLQRYDAWQPIQPGISDYDAYTANNDAASPRGGGASADLLLAALDTPSGAAGSRGALPTLESGSSYIPGFYGPSNRAFSASNGGGSGRGSSGKNVNGGQSGGKGEHGKDGPSSTDGNGGKEGTGGNGGTGGQGGDGGNAGNGGIGGNGGTGGTGGIGGNGGTGGTGGNGGNGGTGGTGGTGGSGGNGIDQPVSVPEPGTLGLLGLGLLSLGLFRRRAAVAR